MPRPTTYTEDRIETKVRLRQDHAAFLDQEASRRGVSRNLVVEMILDRAMAPGALPEVTPVLVQTGPTEIGPSAAPHPGPGPALRHLGEEFDHGPTPAGHRAETVIVDDPVPDPVEEPRLSTEAAAEILDRPAKAAFRMVDDLEPGPPSVQVLLDVEADGRDRKTVRAHLEALLEA